MYAVKKTKEQRRAKTVRLPLIDKQKQDCCLIKSYSELS